MIQRIQSIWLLLATAFGATTFRFPFYSGDWVKDSIPGTIDLNATTTIWLTILAVIVAGVSFVNIFLFDNRKLQLKLCYLGIFLTVIYLVLLFLEMQHFSTGTVAIFTKSSRFIFYFFHKKTKTIPFLNGNLKSI